MLRSQQQSAPAQNLLKRIKEESLVCVHTAISSQHSSDHSLFWPSPDNSDAGALYHSFTTTSSSAFDLDSTPKTVSQLFLDNIEVRSGNDLLPLGLSSLEPDLSTASGPPSASTASGLDSNTLAASTSGCESSPAMSSGSNYNFETSSLHPVPALAAPFATSSPTVGSVGTAEAHSGKTSPSQYEHGWNHQGSYDRRACLESPDEATSTFQTPYSHRNTAAAYQTPHTHQGQFYDHDYQGHGTHPGVPQYLQHRASISGPLMDSAAYAERYDSSAAGPAPPRVHGLAAWENAAGSARPHTADGMFGQFGVVGAGAASHEGSAESSGVGNSGGSSSRPYTSGGHAANVDLYYAQRRMSMPDPSSGSGAGKVFSYIAGDEGSMMPSSSMGMGSHSYGGPYFGGGYNAGASKKRPRRRYDEIERLYPCSWPGCTKSYGTLNHLNAHVAMQKHGPKRSPSEFKDMRKAWRKQKKEEEQRRQSRQVNLTEQALRPSFCNSTYADMSSGELVGGSTGNAAVLPIGAPPALNGFGNQHAAGGVPGMSQLPGSMAHLSRYSMSSVSSVSATPTPTQPFYLNGTSADSASTLGQHDHTHNTTPLQYTGDSRLPYASAANSNSQYSSFGAYLSAHRGSV